MAITSLTYLQEVTRNTGSRYKPWSTKTAQDWGKKQNFWESVPNKAHGQTFIE